MKKKIRATACITIPISVEFEVDATLSEKELLRKVKDKLDVESFYVLNGGEVENSEINTIKLEFI